MVTSLHDSTRDLITSLSCVLLRAAAGRTAARLHAIVCGRSCALRVSAGKDANMMLVFVGVTRDLVMICKVN